MIGTTTTDRLDWIERLRCVECGGALAGNGEGFRCDDCGSSYPLTERNVPVMMTPGDREAFGIVLGAPDGSRMETEYDTRYSRSIGAILWRTLSPPNGVYVNPSAPPFPSATGGLNLWIGGGGIDTGRFVNIDISAFYGVDLVANATRLPFDRDSCDRVACPALLEHVPDPARVVGEIHRVLKPGGRVEAVVPFCHPYHAYPSDYSRFSRDGLGTLFSAFDSIEVGVRTGPTTTILTFLTYYGKLMFPVHAPNPVRRWANRIIMGAFGWISYPAVHVDRWLNVLPEAHVLANHFWVTAYKPDRSGERLLVGGAD